MKVSVLIPSRGRPELLRSSIESWGNRDTEILVVLDTDDAKAYEPHDSNTFVVERKGYAYLDYYYNFLAEKSAGDWLVMWNDDMTWTKDLWRTLENYDPKEPWIIKLNPVGASVAISRKTYELLGHFSVGMSNDGYLMDLGDKAGILDTLEVDAIAHLRDRLDDQTSKDRNEAIKNWMKPQGRRLSESEIQQIFMDVNKIKEWKNENKFASTN